MVKAEEVQVTIVEKQKQIELQAQEILRKQRELEAMVQKPADAERPPGETLADGDRKFQLETEAAGAASAARAKGFAAADVVKATGSAEADANKARGLAEASVIEAQGLSDGRGDARERPSPSRSTIEAAIIQLDQWKRSAADCRQDQRTFGQDRKDRDHQFRPRARGRRKQG